MTNCIHYWVIDSDNVGRCKYCLEVRDFLQLLRRAGVYVVAGRRGAKAWGKKKRQEKNGELL